MDARSAKAKTKMKAQKVWPQVVELICPTCGKFETISNLPACPKCKRICVMVAAHV